MQDITIGKATVVGIEGGWILPGGRIVRNEQQAKMYAIRLNRIIKRGES